ncbi:MAG: glyoxalase [Elainella sp. Prado103]|jgi:predicted enzyme related to lactoylglutathione lyase|nr:glyoxalase [Elainella sp. Prado103]
MQVSTVFVALADPIENLAEFYQVFFALEPAVQVPQVYTEFELPGLRLGIFKPKPDHHPEFMGQAGSMSLCIEVECLEAAIERLRQIGYTTPLDIMTASHGRETYAYDPAGNRLILHESH